MQTKTNGPPIEWDDDLDLDDILELDDHALDFKLDEMSNEDIEDEDLDTLMLPREEGEGFVEHMEQQMDKITISEILEQADDGEFDPYDDEDVYDDGDSFSDDYDIDDVMDIVNEDL